MYRQKVGKVKVFGTQEFLTNLKQELVKENCTDILLTENYLEYYHKENINQFEEGFYDGLQEGLYLAEMYLGIKYGEVICKTLTSAEFFWSDIYGSWKENIFDKYSFNAEYFIYRNSPEYKVDKHNRQINKLEKILAKHKQAVI